LTKDVINVINKEHNQNNNSSRSSQSEKSNSIKNSKKKSSGSSSPSSENEAELTSQKSVKSVQSNNSNKKNEKDAMRDESNHFIVRVYTSDLKDKSGEGTDANVYMHLIDQASNQETEKIWLSKENLREKTASKMFKMLFESGQMDEFLIKPNKNIKLNRIKQIRVGHDNSGLVASAWHLNKVEILNKNDPKSTLVFNCNQWLDKNEGDGNIERLLTTKSKDTGN
jgi:hypothetical protein